MLKKILVVIVGLLLLLVLAALVGPRFVNWNGYKDRVAAAVFQATGRALATVEQLRSASHGESR